MSPLDKVVPFALPGATPATAANWGAVFRNNTDQLLELIAADERHETAGSDASAVTIKLAKAASATAKGSATDMTTTANLKAAADTLQSMPPVTTAGRFLAPGETVFAILTGTPTALAGVSGSMLFRPVL